jgi:hypothetical protein
MGQGAVARTVGIKAIMNVTNPNRRGAKLSSPALSGQTMHSAFGADMIPDIRLSGFKLTTGELPQDKSYRT